MELDRYCHIFVYTLKQKPFTSLNKANENIFLISIISRLGNFGSNLFPNTNSDQPWRLILTLTQSLPSRLEISEILRSAFCIVFSYLPQPASRRKLYLAQKFAFIEQKRFKYQQGGFKTKIGEGVKSTMNAVKKLICVCFKLISNFRPYCISIISFWMCM